MMSDFADRRVTRRRFSTTTGAALFSSLVSMACPAQSRPGPGSDGRLGSRPQSGVTTTASSGALGLATGRDATLQLPSTPHASPLPLLLMLHGASQSGTSMLRRVGAAADEAGVAVLAPDSRGGTWDAIRGEFGEDMMFIDRALEYVFARVSIDPARVIVGGFSDGASYALSLGLANGDLFPRVAAFSPGFVISAAVHGHPRFFVSHGTNDPILPIDQCSRVIVPRLRSMGYDVTFREFDGRHEVPPAVAREAMHWMAATMA
jgi:phospholipase/carboxylesterase